MALTKCKECGQDVSSVADKCPGCGAPVDKGLAVFIIKIIGFFIMFYILFKTWPAIQRLYFS